MALLSEIMLIFWCCFATCRCSFCNFSSLHSASLQPYNVVSAPQTAAVDNFWIPKFCNDLARKMLERNVFVDLLAIAFGIGAWVSINGLWVELPLLVKELPEGWALPSYMAVVIQIANIGPLLYSFLRLCFPSIKSVPVIYVVLSIGSVASLLLALFWKETSFISGYEHSTALIVLLFWLSLVDCTSSVLYIPYLAGWKQIYLSSYLIGEGLSGLLPALVALGQGVGGNAKCENITDVNDTSGEITWQLQQKELNPNFSVDAFFYILFGMMIASSLAFLCLEILPFIQRERSDALESPVIVPSHSVSNADEYELVKIEGPSNNGMMRRPIFYFLLIVQSWSCLLANGFLPAIQSYSCGPYGNVPFHLAVALSALANPLAAFSTMILPRASPKTVGFLSIFATGFGVYIITTALMSPTPPLVGLFYGSILIVFVWISFSGIITYVRVEIANLMREDGAQPLFWSGVVTQAGSAVGAFLAFILVNKTNIFEYFDPCR